MSATKPKSRRRRKQEQRRIMRTAMQNDLVLRGWVPVRDGGTYGLAHASDFRAVLRRFECGVWCYKALNVGGPRILSLACDWSEMQAQWMRGLRAVVIQRGWL